MSYYQNIVGNQLAEAALTTTIATLYTVPANTRTYIKDIHVNNTTAGALTFTLYLVPNAGSIATSNALFYTFSVPANSIYHWTGTQIIPASSTIRALASAPGLTMFISGGEAT
jgi:hypothetical protein